ncbi:hypothetical protein Nepgr_029703 [Nepenthes gracilis]|uniref:Uncharacterized protein n=1 Tax=Nepenthes gracilis TaxID=150966 RepID=A0AAD3TD28_NEPGR|nr:hypothetical protein Nepgr_029703 [Nepenthes gracilis]
MGLCDFLTLGTSHFGPASAPGILAGCRSVMVFGTAVGNFCWVLGICCKVGQTCGPVDMLLSTALTELKLEWLQYPL